MKLDEFTSRFRRASKVRYRYSPIRLTRVLFVTDQAADEAQRRLSRARRLLRCIDEEEESVAWEVVTGDAYTSGQELLELIEAKKPDLIVTTRALKEKAADLVYSLGAFLDVLAQVCVMPVLVLPADADLGDDDVEEGTPQVMVVTDHLTGEDRLVDWGVRFVLGRTGDLHLTHVEDDYVFERYMEVISKLESLDTDVARRDILEQLLREPQDYIKSCEEELKAQGQMLKVHSDVQLGHKVSTYKELAKSHGADLLVFVTKDETQVAMHGVAYSLAVELKQLPLLLL